MFILNGLQLVKRLPQIQTVEKPIFIIGTGRSGSTILGKILSMHREIGFLNEPKAIWYCVDPRDDINGHFQLGMAKYHFSAQDVTPMKRKAAKRLFAFYLDVVNSKRIVDKNPEIIFRIPYIKTIFPDAKFIFLVRNGLDTIFSIADWSRRECKIKNGRTEDWWGLDRRKWGFIVDQLVPEEPLLTEYSAEINNFTRQEDMAAVEWIIAMQQGLRNIDVSSNSIFTLHYENLTQKPKSEIIELLDFCELCDDKVFFSYSEKVLSPNISKPAVEISPVIRNAFMSTMEALNYSTTVN